MLKVTTVDFQSVRGLLHFTAVTSWAWLTWYVYIPSLDIPSLNSEGQRRVKYLVVLITYEKAHRIQMQGTAAVFLSYKEKSGRDLGLVS